MYQTFTNTLSQVTDKYALLKKEKCLSKPVPYMNKTLNKLFIRKLQNNRSATNWENTDNKEILSLKLKRIYVNLYCIERCVGGCKAKDFWLTVKPF